MKLNLEWPFYATTYGTGPFHPAIRANGQTHYWPNITFATESEAHVWAMKAVQDVTEAADNVTEHWNVFPT